MATVNFMKRFSELLCIICLYEVEAILFMCMYNDTLWTIVFGNKKKISELNWFIVVIATTRRLGWSTLYSLLFIEKWEKFRYSVLLLEKWEKFWRRMKNCETGEGLLRTRISCKSAKIGPSRVSSILPHLLHI